MGRPKKRSKRLRSRNRNESQKEDMQLAAAKGASQQVFTQLFALYLGGFKVAILLLGFKQIEAEIGKFKRFKSEWS